MRQSFFAFFHASQAFLQSGHEVDHVALGGFACRCLTFLPFSITTLLTEGASKVNAPPQN
jgi:hypothetical protein